MSEPSAPDVYFPLEITTREYAGHLLLAVALACRGIHCAIGFKGVVGRALRESSRPGILFYKGGQGGGWRNSTQHTQVGLDPEAGIVYPDFNDFFNNRPALHDMSTTRLQFCYGSDDYNVFKEKFPHLADRFHLTGAPRVSLWGSDGDVFHSNAISSIRDRYGTIILFASSGGFVHERYAEMRGQSPAANWKAASNAQHFLQVARNTAVSSPGVSVVIRPHPSDSWFAWQSAVADLPNLHVESSQDLSVWARAASVVVHPGTSTAALEAICAGVPALSTASNPGTNVAADISYSAPTAADVLEFHQQRVGGGLEAVPSAAAHALLRKKLHHPVSGAAQRVADVLMRTFDFAGPSGIPRPKLGANLRNPMRMRPRVMGLNSGSQPAFKRSPLEIQRVEEDVAAAQSVLGADTQLDVRKLAPNCFLIRPGH